MYTAVVTPVDRVCRVVSRACLCSCNRVSRVCEEDHRVTCEKCEINTDDQEKDWNTGATLEKDWNTGETLEEDWNTGETLEKDWNAKRNNNT